MGPAIGGYTGRASQRVVGVAEQAGPEPVQRKHAEAVAALKGRVPVAEAPPLAIDPQPELLLVPRALQASSLAAVVAPGYSRHPRREPLLAELARRVRRARPRRLGYLLPPPCCVTAGCRDSISDFKEFAPVARSWCPSCKAPDVLGDEVNSSSSRAPSAAGLGWRALDMRPIGYGLVSRRSADPIADWPLGKHESRPVSKQ